MVVTALNAISGKCSFKSLVYKVCTKEMKRRMKRRFFFLTYVFERTYARVGTKNTSPSKLKILNKGAFWKNITGLNDIIHYRTIDSILTCR